MAVAVVFAFAVADGLPPVAGAAPYDVLARQLPRLLVARMNGDGDRGVRFFPFLGPVDGRRSFLRPRAPFEPALLTELHRQGDVQLLADAHLRSDGLAWRVLDGRSGAVRQQLELPFDPRHPLEHLARLEFELTGLLGWSGRPSARIALAGEALGWFLVLKDQLLRREANVIDPDPDPLRAARRCVELAANDRDVQRLVTDYVALLLRRGERTNAFAALLAALAPSIDDAAALDRIGGLAAAAGDEALATRLVVRAALAAPHEAEFVERAAAMAYRAGDDDAVARVVGAGRRVGAATTGALAQLAVSRDRRGDQEGCRALVQELAGHDDLPAPVARLVVSFLLGADQASRACALAERALAKAPEHAALHFELGRASLLLGEEARAGVALQRALDLGLPAAMVETARRLLRLSLVPGLWAGAQRVERALATGEPGDALVAVRDLLREVGPVAEAWLLFGVAWQRLGSARRAERLLRRALRCDERCAEAHNRLGVLLLQRGSLGDGHAHLARAHALAPEDASTQLHLAQACALRGDRAEAELLVDSAQRLGADPRLVQAVRKELQLPGA